MGSQSAVSISILAWMTPPSGDARKSQVLVQFPSFFAVAIHCTLHVPPPAAREQHFATLIVSP